MDFILYKKGELSMSEFQNNNNFYNPQPNQNQSPPNYSSLLTFSILELICCNQIFGILGLVFTTLADSAYKSGNYAEYESKSKLAKIMLIIGFALTFGFGFLYLIFSTYFGLFSFFMFT